MCVWSYVYDAVLAGWCVFRRVLCVLFVAGTARRNGRGRRSASRMKRRGRTFVGHQQRSVSKLQEYSIVSGRSGGLPFPLLSCVVWGV